ncbi:hypothetical protein Tco_0244788, partial [Tanacetum coccineum]
SAVPFDFQADALCLIAPAEPPD